MRISDNELTRHIGSGGMGEVWAAQNVHTKVRYAVKLMPAEIAQDKNFVARFFDEGRVMSELNHLNIVRVHHVGRDDKSGRCAYWATDE
jgi:serine/threonine protein kinase